MWHTMCRIELFLILAFSFMAFYLFLSLSADLRRMRDKLKSLEWDLNEEKRLQKTLNSTYSLRLEEVHSKILDVNKNMLEIEKNLQGVKHAIHSRVTVNDCNDAKINDVKVMRKPKKSNTRKSHSQ